MGTIFLLAIAAPLAADTTPALRTVAEQSEYQATASFAQVTEYCQQLAKRSAVVRLHTLGKSAEGRALPMLVLAKPAVATAEQARDARRPVVLAIGGMHAGEVCGKEALLLLARELALAKEHPLLEKLTLVVIPLLNADGNERTSTKNRPGQVGPAAGMGQRTNAKGLDLNRDFVKLESPELRSLARILRHWDPAVVIDTHTTNGSHHRYTITYDCPRHPACHEELIGFARDALLPEAGRRMAGQHGYRSYFYGNFTEGHTLWKTYPALPRHGTQYFGLRGRIGILSEAYAYAPYRDRVLATRDFVRQCLEVLAEKRTELDKLLKLVRQSTSAERSPDKRQQTALRRAPAALGAPVTILGFVEQERDGRTLVTEQPHDYQATYLGKSAATLSVPRPWAYLLAAKHASAVENLQRHGIEVEQLREDIELDLEVYTVTSLTRAPKPYQGHKLVAGRSGNAPASTKNASRHDSGPDSATAGHAGRLFARTAIRGRSVCLGFL